MADRPPTDPTDPSAVAADRPTGHGEPGRPVSLEEAADRLGITANAVRQRLKRGTLAGHKTPAGWVVVLPTDHAIGAGDPGQREHSGQDAPATGSGDEHGAERPAPAFRPSVAAWRERTTRAVDLDEPSGATPWWRRIWWRRDRGR